MDGRVMQVPRRSSFWSALKKHLLHMLPKILLPKLPWRSDHEPMRTPDRRCIDLGLKRLPFPSEFE
jgi:hypothetical protein